MREMLGRRPWLLIVLLLGAMVLVNLVLVYVALMHPVTPASVP